ncbi:MAG TPA: hypothetical protein PLA19_02515 [Candidatus Pacearchaeota archaeon]|nr:hypothetical protein [Candidatus Pacearchaeota archaeon]
MKNYVFAVLLFVGLFFVATSNQIFAASYFVIGQDPGMKTARIANTKNPQDPLFFQLCPNDPNQKCYGNVSAGSGFYTLAYDNQPCMPNTGMIYDADSNNRQVSCPYYFNWKRQDKDLIANLKIDTLGFLVDKTENIYLGIQTNNAGGVPYYGLDFNNNYHAPKIENIDKISLKIRTKICYTPKKDDIYRSGRIMYYFGWWNVEKQQRETISLDILHFWRPSGHKPGWVTEYVNTEAELSGKTADDPDYNIRKHTIYVNGKALGVIPESYDFYYDSTPNCSSSIDNATWLQIDIPVKSLIKRLLQEGFIDKEILEGAKYSGSILGGIEFWGRNLVELEVKDHTMYGKVCVGNNIDQTGNCNEVCGAASICNGMRPLDFIPFCDKGGNSAIHDRCSATCQPEDRLDNMCRKTGVSDCTGGAGCDKKTPGQCSENALKKCNFSCKEISSCGDGICNCGENQSNCVIDCVASCIPKTCATLGNYQCGSWSDGCGKTLNCGTCTSGKTCNAGQCVSNCSSRAAKKCDGADLYWYNSCNAKEGLAQNCSAENKICRDGVCVSSGGGGGIIEPQKEQPQKMTRAEILVKIQEIKRLLIQLIAQLIAELQKQLAAMQKNN